MRLIIAGSRSISSLALLTSAIEASGFQPSSVVCGCAAGVDSLGQVWALARGIPVTRFPADWTRFGRSAGHRRNVAMAQHADAVLLLWDGTSPGTADMRAVARAHHLPGRIFLVKTAQTTAP